MSRMLCGLHRVFRVMAVSTLLTVLLAAGGLGLWEAAATPHAHSAAASHSQVQAGRLAVRPMVQCPGLILPC